jgi:hypothetical protein
LTAVIMSPDAALTVALSVTERLTGLTGDIIVTPGGEQLMLMSIIEHGMPMELVPMAVGAPIELVPIPPPPQPARSAAPSNGSNAEDDALRNHAVARIVDQPPRVPTWVGVAGVRNGSAEGAENQFLGTSTIA